MEIRRGDVFCVDSDSLISKAIQLVEKIHSADDVAEFNHAGIILDSNGSTFEALWRVKESKLGHYDGKNILISRPTFDVNGQAITGRQIEQGLQQMIKEKKGDFYPVHRLFLHFLGPMVAKYFSTGKYDVCSELVTTDYLSPSPMFAWRGNAKGINPDTLADRLIAGRMYKTIHYGELVL